MSAVIKAKRTLPMTTMLETGGGRHMFRMIFAIVIGVMEKTPRRDRRQGS